MPEVRVRENEPFEIALRRFKRMCEKAGVLTEIRRREYYEKPTAIRKRKAAAAVKRQSKKSGRDIRQRVRMYWFRLFFGPHPMSDSNQGLKTRLTEEMKAAMRSKDKERLGVIRLVLSAIKQREVDERIELDDTQVLVVLEKMLKQRRDSIEQFRNGNREDLAIKEEFEVGILQEYMPAALSEQEIDTILEEIIIATGASSIKDMGKVMAQLKPKIQGKADMGAVSQKIKARLAWKAVNSIDTALTSSKYSYY